LKRRAYPSNRVLEKRPQSAGNGSSHFAHAAARRTGTAGMALGEAALGEAEII
jgi:hypothetical protein